MAQIVSGGDAARRVGHVVGVAAGGFSIGL